MPKEKPKETLIGEVMSFYIHINVIAIQLSAPLKIGDKIHVKGATTDFTQKVDSMDVIKQLREDELTGELIQIASCGSGCLFVHNSVLKKITFHYSKEHDKQEKNYFVFDDAFFCKDMTKLKIPIYADTSMICKHLIKQKGWTWADYYSKNQNNNI